MNEDIGLAAGKVWSYLDANGETTLAKLRTGTGLDDRMLQMALGWLAREDKVEFAGGGRAGRVRLTGAGASG